MCTYDLRRDRARQALCGAIMLAAWGAKEELEAAGLSVDDETLRVILHAVTVGSTGSPFELLSFSGDDDRAIREQRFEMAWKHGKRGAPNGPEKRQQMREATQ